MYATPTRPMTQHELDMICRVWADCGSDDSTDLWLQLWDGGNSADQPETRDAIIGVAEACGLETKVENGVLMVQKTQQLHDEIGERWI